MKDYFVITTDKEVALSIEAFFKSGVLSNGRSVELGKVEHYEGYSDVQIVAREEGVLIKPSDIFWLGWYSKNISVKMDLKNSVK